MQHQVGPKTTRQFGRNGSMDGLSIELTNACSRRCLHCFRNKEDPPDFLPLPLARDVLNQARNLGFQTVCLTGGEVALYPDLEEILKLLVKHNFTFTLVTNGHRFREKLLPLLAGPQVREKLKLVCLSLDGASAESHDALRGSGSFREVVEAATLCQFKGIPVSFKSVVTNFNKEELSELALLGANLEAQDQSFLNPLPAPRSVREGVIPLPDEMREIMEGIIGILAKAMHPRILIEGFSSRTALFSCSNILHCTHMDYQGNQILCCNLSHSAREEGQSSVFGREWLGNLKEMPLREGLVRHYHRIAQLMEARVRDIERLNDLTFIPCFWCLQHFGKLDWLRDFPESPWFIGVRGEKETCGRLNE
jgi:sulfatase maturation enzyme AslB (radical SAM superfamily)